MQDEIRNNDYSNKGTLGGLFRNTYSDMNAANCCSDNTILLFLIIFLLLFTNFGCCNNNLN